jgi:two-component system, NtrC family, response regulator
MILIIDDDIAVRTSISLLLKNAGYKTKAVESPDEAMDEVLAQDWDLVIMDMNYSVETSGEEGIRLLRRIKEARPKFPVILITGWGTIQLAVEGMKLGAADFVHKPWQNDHLLQTVQTAIALSQEKVKEEIPIPANRKELDQKFKLANIIGADPALLRVLETIGRISPTDASVLIQGESGTGKELIAEAIHQNSNRRVRPFIKVNLGGISSSLFESEMFGHKKGSFTDAKADRVGRFELANKGTIFLDEIGDLDMNSQVKLLRVLQDRTYEVLGDSKSRSVDVRVICATNKNLEEMVEAGKFREDLYYRINLITVKLPALRERPDDIPLLASHFISNLRQTYNRPEIFINAKGLKYLKGLALPGNIRELKNLVERTVLVTPHNELTVEDFEGLKNKVVPKAVKETLPPVGALTLEEMEITMIKKAIEHHNGNISKVAKSLGLSRGALYRRLDKFNIPYEINQNE